MEGLAADLSCFALRPCALGQREASEGDPERCGDALQVWMIADYDGDLASQLACMHAVSVTRHSRALDASICATWTADMKRHHKLTLRVSHLRAKTVPPVSFERLASAETHLHGGG